MFGYITLIFWEGDCEGSEGFVMKGNVLALGLDIIIHVHWVADISMCLDGQYLL